MLEEKRFKILLEKLDLLVKVTILNAIKDRELREQVRFLSKFGFKPREIADFLGKTPNYVRVILHELRMMEKKG